MSLFGRKHCYPMWQQVHNSQRRLFLYYFGFLNPIRPGLLGGIKSRGGGCTKNHTFENPLLIVKML